jgi:predicted RNA-binding Zn-ribbon protein involved in translation (DUF1610 family)
MALALPFRANCSTRADLFRQIFRDHFDRWCDLRLEDEVPADQRAYVRETVQRMMLCRDPEAGYARYECPGCGFDLRVPFSCKTRFCPSCGKVRVDAWVNGITQDLLEVPHLHLTLTTDDALRPFFHADRALLNDLLQVAPQAVQAVLIDLYTGVRVGMIYTPHTFGRDLGFKPHVHLVMTKGGLKDNAWLDIDEVPGGRLAAKWRYLLCQRLRQRRPHDADLQRVIAQTYVDHHGFQVYTESFYPKGLDAAQYIGRYLGHPPLATSHLTAYDGQQVTYWYIDTATKAKQTVTCSALDFISRLIPHIPPKGMQLVRHAGLYARSIKRQCAEMAHTALEALRTQLPLFALEPLRKVLPNPKWRERIKASFGYDPLACPRCGQTMQLAEIWEPKRGHVWMRRWLETHRALKALREAFSDLRARPLDHFQQLGLGFANTS